MSSNSPTRSILLVRCFLIVFLYFVIDVLRQRVDDLMWLVGSVAILGQKRSIAFISLRMKEWIATAIAAALCPFPLILQSLEVLQHLFIRHLQPLNLLEGNGDGISAASNVVEAPSSHLDFRREGCTFGKPCRIS